MKNHLTTAIIAAAILGFALQAATIDLASGGKTTYTIVAPEKPSGEEQEAVKDLRWHLNYITGAKFNIGKAGEKNIFVGRKAPSDNNPLGRYERRIRNENGSIYLYGSGTHGNYFAIYDFLEEFLGCQWYSFFADFKVPRQKVVTFDSDKLNRNIIPSFNSCAYRGSIYTRNTVRAAAFRRRARIYDNQDKDLAPVPTLGASYPHMPSRVIPSGFVPYGKSSPLYGPLKYFRDKAYFKTNPEWFSLNRRGKRTWEYQHCYSNKELRKEMIKNYQIIIDNEYRGGEADMHLDLNDKGKYGMPICYCKECAKLNEKYGDPAGSYYDAVIEISKHFLEKYPQIRFKIVAYQLTRDVPRKYTGKFPKNVLVRIAALDETNFLKPYEETPAADAMFKSWSKVAGGDLMVQLYPTVYPRPLFTRPLVANINRLVQNLRYIHKLGFTDFESEFGVGPVGAVGFNELRVYLFARLAKNIDLNVDELIEDFMINYYGKEAAPIMLKYYRELEECEKKETRFMRWWPDHRSCLTYLTPENILRWQGYFEEMFKVTDPKTRQHLNIRRARQNLDEATLSIWYKFAPGEMPDRNVILKRHTATAAADIRDMLRTYTNKKEQASYYRAWITKHNRRPIYYHYALAGEWKPLPEPFASIPEDQILRTVPYINRGDLINDAEAATGITAAGSQLPEKLVFTAARWERSNVEKREVFPVEIPAAEVKAGKGYNFYHIGSTRLYPDMNIYFNMIRGGGLVLGYLYDEKNPEQVYDIYVSIKYDEKTRQIMSDQAVLVKNNRASRKLKEDNAPRINDAGQFV